MMVLLVRFIVSVVTLDVDFTCPFHRFGRLWIMLLQTHFIFTILYLDDAFKGLLHLSSHAFRSHCSYPVRFRGFSTVLSLLQNGMPADPVSYTSASSEHNSVVLTSSFRKKRAQ